MRYWTTSRQELIDTGANLCYRGYLAPHVAQSMVERHFRGNNAKTATARLQRSIIQGFYQKYKGLTKYQVTIDRMARRLRAEGWRPLFDEGRCLWIHASGVTVNCAGGYFRSYQEATTITYESQTRMWVAQRADQDQPR